MRLGVVFPQTEIATDPIAVRDYAQAAESLGYDHLLAFDHVLGANADSRPGWSGAYRHTDTFLEPFVLFGHLAAVTERLELVTGVIILPQRQTTAQDNNSVPALWESVSSVPAATFRANSRVYGVPLRSIGGGGKITAWHFPQ